MGVFLENTYEINLLHTNGSKDCLGHMEERHVTHNRYNEGLLIGAGKLHNSDIQKQAFLRNSTLFRNTATLEFKGKNKTFRGTFCFINFIPETNTVVFGSIGSVTERCSLTGKLVEQDKHTGGLIELEEALPETAIAV